MIMSLEEAQQKYGFQDNKIWLGQLTWCGLMPVPHPLSMYMLNTAAGRRPTTHIYCNKDLMDPLTKAFRNVIDRLQVGYLKTFDGCFNIRDVRGEPGKISAHSYGLAIDFNAATNRLGTEGDMPEELAKCFTDEGFAWGKNFNRKDPMHFSRCWE
jgi:hypothetical protein